jgi:hypothetical protein
MTARDRELIATAISNYFRQPHKIQDVARDMAEIVLDSKSDEDEKEMAFTTLLEALEMLSDSGEMITRGEP